MARLKVILGTVVLAVLLGGCTGSGGGSSDLIITPTSQPFTTTGQVKKFVIEVEGPATVKLANTQLTDTTHFEFPTNGGVGNCYGEVIEEGDPCTEEIKLSELKSGLNAKFRVTPGVGAIAESTLTTP